MGGVNINWGAVYKNHQTLEKHLPKKQEWNLHLGRKASASEKNILFGRMQKKLYLRGGIQQQSQ
jgi:hypothetical protein